MRYKAISSLDVVCNVMAGSARNRFSRPFTFVTYPTAMNNLEGLTPEQKKFITGLSKRIHSLESKLVVLQAKMVKIDPTIMTSLAQNFKQLNLN
jgi:hypothetical protein